MEEWKESREDSSRPKPTGSIKVPSGGFVRIPQQPKSIAKSSPAPKDSSRPARPFSCSAHLALILLIPLEASPLVFLASDFRSSIFFWLSGWLVGAQVIWTRTSIRRSLDARTVNAPPGSDFIVANAPCFSPPPARFSNLESFCNRARAKMPRPSLQFLPPGSSMRNLVSLLLILAGLLIPFQNLCAQQPTQPHSGAEAASVIAVKSPVDNSGVEHPAPAERYPRYRINRSDVLSLSFALSPEFNQNVTVQPDGFITLQGVGSLNILGLTLPEAVVAIKNAYSKILRDPIIDIDLTDFQKAYFIVTGQVGKPGQYDLRYDLTVSEAIAVAGGFLPTAKTQVFLYRRAQTGWVEAKELKMKDFLHGKNVNEDVDMHPGDMIFVPEKTITKIRKYIPYSIGIPLSTTPGVY